MHSSQDNIKIISSFDYTIDTLRELYTDVFENASLDNIFLDFEWISTWIKCSSIKPELIVFESQKTNKKLGFVFIGCINSTLGKIFLLNQTGNREDDQIWIEYNDVICARDHELCRKSLLDYIASKPKAFKFIGVNNTCVWQHKQWNEWSLEATNGYKTKTVDAPHPSFTSQFSKNTRSQISRSERFINEHIGEILMDWVDESQLEITLNEMAKLHIEQWGEHVLGSGFSNPKFVDFHRQFIRSGIASWVHIAKFSASEQTLGYLYFFTRNKRVYFYLSAINYRCKDNKYKPGLLMHKLAMQHFESKGFTTYDFLAGDARYKKSLSNQKYLLYGIQLYLNKWYYLPIKTCVNIKRWFVQRTIKR